MTRATRTALRLLGTSALGLVVLPLVLVGSAQGAGYPSPPHDFSHPGTNHVGRSSLFSSLGGHEDRPILVIYARWEDVDYPAAFDAAAVAQRFFGTGFPSITFPSVGDYFRRLSFNALFLFPAAETHGTHNDGVVQVTVPGTKAEFFTLSERARNSSVLRLADPFVDFASFDLDGSGTLTDLELVVNVLEAEPALPLWAGCGITRGHDVVSLDGIGLTSLNVAMNNTATNLITIIHENAHVAMDMVDLYGFDVGGFDLGAATCGFSDSTLFAPSAWHKLHWGWITPTVVANDGFHAIRRADLTGDAFLLYDPDRGTDAYFLLENRRRTMGTYDQGAGGDGLVIWRVADDQLGVASGIPPIGLVRPTSTTKTWDAANPLAPQRTMSEPWADGTPSSVAVRAIGAAGEVVRAYLDVRGPGILVDTYPVDSAAPVRLAAAWQNQIDVPVMNTGEACDTFVFEAVDLPAGWTMAALARILCAGETSVAGVTVTPDANAAVGLHAITIRGRSLTEPTVTTDAPLSVDVLTIEGSIELVADWIDALLAGAPSAGVSSALGAARDELVGNNGGFAANGALDKLESDDPVAAITKLRAAIRQLLEADARGASSPTSLKEVLVLAAEAIATAEYEETKAAVGTPSRGEQRALARIAELIEAARAQLLADRYVDACETFREAAARALELQG